MMSFPVRWIFMDLLLKPLTCYNEILITLICSLAEFGTTLPNPKIERTNVVDLFTVKILLLGEEESEKDLMILCILQNCFLVDQQHALKNDCT